MDTSSRFLQRAIRKINKTVSSWFFIDQWVILTAQDLSMDSLEWSAFKPLIPPPDRYWADPFVIAKEDRYYVFIEEKMYQTGLGHIACLELDANGDLLSNPTVLKRSYHLSYPFLFEYRDQLYMLPESAQNKTLEIYRCAHFPDRWEFVSTLMQNVYAVDATLLQHGGKWWLFANIKQSDDSSSLDQLSLFWAEDPLSQKWNPHPLNPVVNDARTARPAGHIFSRSGNLIRPSQDNAVRYGKALNFNCITKLSETEYEEVCEVRFEPPRGTKILATHTYNKAGELSVIDAVIRRRK
ncbi:MAG: hypothetical protein WBL25_07130 [Anaerolineales bacterium]